MNVLPLRHEIDHFCVILPVIVFFVFVETFQRKWESCTQTMSTCCCIHVPSTVLTRVSLVPITSCYIVAPRTGSIRNWNRSCRELVLYASMQMTSNGFLVEVSSLLIRNRVIRLNICLYVYRYAQKTPTHTLWCTAFRLARNETNVEQLCMSAVRIQTTSSNIALSYLASISEQT